MSANKSPKLTTDHLAASGSNPEEIRIILRLHQIEAMSQPMLLGGVVSFVLGVMCQRWLIRLLVADRLHWFAIYCLIVGSLTIAWQSELFVR